MPYLASERSERDTIRGVKIRAGAIYIHIYGGTYAIIVAHATHKCGRSLSTAIFNSCQQF